MVWGVAMAGRCHEADRRLRALVGYTDRGARDGVSVSLSLMPMMRWTWRRCHVARGCWPVPVWSTGWGGAFTYTEVRGCDLSV